MRTLRSCLFGGAVFVAGIAQAKPTGPAMHGPPSHGHAGPGTDSALWDQLWNAYQVGGSPVVNQEFPDYPAYSTYFVDDFTTAGQTWNISSITTWFTAGETHWDQSITSGKLQFFKKSGALPDNVLDIAPEYSVPIALTNFASAWLVVADTTGISELQGVSGEYWIGITPTVAFDLYGQEFQYVGNAAPYGDQAAARNPGGAWGLGTDWIGAEVYTNLFTPEVAFRLEGDVVPAPGSTGVAGVAGLIAARRRRSGPRRRRGGWLSEIHGRASPRRRDGLSSRKATLTGCAIRRRFK